MSVPMDPEPRRVSPEEFAESCTRFLIDTRDRLMAEGRPPEIAHAIAIARLTAMMARGQRRWWQR